MEGGTAKTPRLSLYSSCTQTRSGGRQHPGRGNDRLRLRARVADAEVDVPGLLREGFMPEAVAAFVSECLVFTPFFLRFSHAPTQRAFDAEVALGQSNAALVFLIFEIIVQSLVISLLSIEGYPTTRNIMIVSLLASIVATVAEVARIVVVSRARGRLTQIAANAAQKDDTTTVAGSDSVQQRTSHQSMGLSVANPMLTTSIRGVVTSEAPTVVGSPRNESLGPSSQDLHEGALLVALQRPLAGEMPRRWLLRAATISEGVGIVMLLSPLMSVILQFIATPDAFCAAGAQEVEPSSGPQRTFYCSHVTRVLLASLQMYSMITRIPSFPMTMIISALVILVAALRSFSVLSDPNVPVVLRAFQFVLVLMVVLLQVAFRWVVDAAAVRSFADRRRAAAHVERLRYEHEALEAYAAELVPQLQRRRHSIPRDKALRDAPLPETGTASAASSSSSLGDLLATRDFAGQAAVLAVGLLDYARFCCNTMPHPCAVATAALLSQVHEAVCPDGAGDDAPDVTERSGDTYIAVFGLVGTRNRGVQASALAAGRCLAAVADLGTRSESRRDGNGAAIYPELCMALHVGPVLGEFPGMSASTQRYSVCGGGVDGALAMLASCKAPDDTILLSAAAVDALGEIVLDAGLPDTVFSVAVGDGAFGIPQVQVVTAHACVTLALDVVLTESTFAPVVTTNSNAAAATPTAIMPLPAASAVDTGSWVPSPEEDHILPQRPHPSDISTTALVQEEKAFERSNTQAGQSLPTLLPGMGASVSRGGLSMLGPSIVRDAGAARVLSHCVAGAERLRMAVMAEQQRRLCLDRAPLCGLVGGGGLQSGGSRRGLFASLRPLCFADIAVEHRYREGYLRRGHWRLPHLAMDALFIFAGAYVLVDFFIGSLFWDRSLAAAFGEADELALFSPKHTAALAALIVWEVLAVGAAAVRYRTSVPTVPPCTEERGLLRVWAEGALLSHTTRFTIFGPILMLFQPSVFSMNPGYAGVLFIGALYLDPLPAGYVAPRLAVRHLLPGVFIILMGFVQPLLNVEMFLFPIYLLWPIAALMGRLATDRRDRAAFVAVEATAAYCDALGQQEVLRGEVLDGAAPPQMRQLLANMTTAAMASSSEEGDGEDNAAAKAASEGAEEETARPAAETETLAQPCRDYGRLRVGAAGRPAAVLQLEHAVLVRVRFDALFTTGDDAAKAAVDATPKAEFGPTDVAAAVACVVRAERFAAFVALLDAVVQAHAPLSVIEARRDEVLVGGPWGETVSQVPDIESEGKAPTERFAAAALGFLRDLRSRAAAMPGYGHNFSFSAVATAEDAFVLMRSTLYPSFDVLGPGAGRVRELLRAAPPGTVAVTDAFRRCLPTTGPVFAPPDRSDMPTLPQAALWATRYGQRARMTGLDQCSSLESLGR